jgi:5-methylcytosine-specific restriction endonuclease McrA
MARPRLRARFFVAPSGEVIERARDLVTAQRRAIFKRDKGRCVYCRRRVSLQRVPFDFGATVFSGAIDHVFPRARGGQNDDSNLALSCESCNASKGAS